MGLNTLNLKVGTEIRIGEEYAKRFKQFKTGKVITLVEGCFEYDNGLYCQDIYTPSYWDGKAKEFDSIYHLFGNKLEDFMDCEIIKL